MERIVGPGIKAVRHQSGAGGAGAFQTDIWTRGAVMGEQATKETSLNLQRSLRMRSVIEKLPKADPIVVAQLIAAIAQHPNPKLRYLVRRHGKLQPALKRILPLKWIEKVLPNFLKLDQQPSTHNT